MITYTEQYEVTTFEQAERLLQMGLHPSTSDCYFDKLTEKITFGLFSDIDLRRHVHRFIPLWSAGHLISLMFRYSQSGRSLTITKGNFNMEYLTRVMEGILKYDNKFAIY